MTPASFQNENLIAKLLRTKSRDCCCGKVGA